MNHKEKWMKAMIAKHGSEEAVKEFMKQAQKKSRENYKGTGGFAANRELAKEWASKAAKIRWEKYYDDKNKSSSKAKNDEGGQMAEKTSSS